jgi:amidase
MSSTNTDWERLGSTKKHAILASIPDEWRIPGSIPSAEELLDVTGTGIQQYLSPREIEITETDAVDIVAKTCSGKWTAVEVTKAFCHRASIAHQLVCPKH